jgi:hypothetical protein
MPIAMKRDYHAFDRAVFGIGTCKSNGGDEPAWGLFQAAILKDRRERRASTVRERRRPAHKPDNSLLRKA